MKPSFTLPALLSLLSLSSAQNVTVPTTCQAPYMPGTDTVLYTVPYTYDQVLGIIGSYKNLTVSPPQSSYTSFLPLQISQPSSPNHTQTNLPPPLVVRQSRRHRNPKRHQQQSRHRPLLHNPRPSPNRNNPNLLLSTRRPLLRKPQRRPAHRPPQRLPGRKLLRLLPPRRHNRAIHLRRQSHQFQLDCEFLLG